MRRICFRLSRGFSSVAQDVGVFPNDLGVSYLVGDKTSHVFGSRTPPLRELTVDEMFVEQVEARPSSQALIVSDGATTLVKHSFESLNSKVNKLAAGLLRLGIEKGDRVGVWLPNNEEWILSQFAAARIGAILVCVNPAYRKRELVHALNMVQAKALIFTPNVSKSNYIEIMQDIIPDLVSRIDPYAPLQSASLPSLEHLILVDGDETNASCFIPFQDLLEEHPSEQLVCKSLLPQEPINIQFTSGTTGSPKGATLSSYSIVNNARFVGNCMKLSHEDVVNVCVPLYHCFGLVLGNLAAFSQGASVVYPARVFHPSKTLEAVEAFHCSALYGVPTMFAAELNLPDFDKYNLKTLRTGIMAGSTCPIDLMRKAVKRMNLTELLIAYGQTETSPVSFMSRTTDNEVTRCETVGRVMPHVECKVVDSDGNTVPLGVPGELYTRGYLTMLGYYRDSSRTREMFDGSWLKTGDIVEMDASGYLRIVGRSKDVIIRGGENLFPREIEEVIQEIPGVLNVQVVGVPDDIFGEVVCAVIVPVKVTGHGLTYESVCAYIKSQLSHQKVPHYVLFKDTMEDVVTVTGKLQKFKLRDWACEQLNLSS